jgi:hypothetical protein
VVIILVKVNGVLKLHRTLDHKIGTVPTDAAVHNNSVDLHSVRLLGVAVALALLALE